MITLHIDITTASERKPFDPENIEDTITDMQFESINDICLYLLCDLVDDESKVYVLAYGSDEDGIVYVDHCEPNIIENIRTQARVMSNENLIRDIFLFAQETYEDAYNLALDMKEQTGMAWKWQREESPTITNNGIKLTSNAN